jgi:hypothetical protein
MELAGMGSGEPPIAHHRIAVDLDQAFGLADAATLVQVREDRVGFLGAQMRSIHRRALPLGKPELACAALEKSISLVPAVEAMDAKIARVSLAIFGAGGVLAAERGKIVHARSRSVEAIALCLKHREVSVYRKDDPRSK